MFDNVRRLKELDIDKKRYPNQFVGCLVLTKDKKLLLQRRKQNWSLYPGYLCEFGGHIKHRESPVQAIIRELHEELGAQVHEKDLIPFGAISEPKSHPKDLIYVFFWHDRNGTITGCYEGEAHHFDNSTAILNHTTQITDGLRWLLAECKQRGLIQ